MLSQVVELIEAKRRFAITSHIRPDGDSLGSSLGLYWLLRALDKDVEVIMRDPVPHAYQQLPGANDVRVTPAVDPSYHAVFVIECSDITRPGLGDLEKQFVVNIDHHSTTALFGSINWIDSTASAVGEMIYNLCKATGVRVTKEIAECVYTALITDTGSFHYSNISPRTFDTCRQCVEAGVNPQAVARAVFDSNSLGRLKLFGAVLSGMQLDAAGQIATLTVDEQLLADCGATYDDTDGLINLPLTVKGIQAVIFFKKIGPDDWRISLRSKGNIDVNAVAKQFGGGGHKNASGCSATGSLDSLKALFQKKVLEQVELAGSR